jgi:hypothetical protein
MTELSHCLARTVEECEGFCLKSAAYFPDIPGAVLIDQAFCDLQSDFDDLKSLMKMLEDAAHSCDCFFQNVS